MLLNNKLVSKPTHRAKRDDCPPRQGRYPYRWLTFNILANAIDLCIDFGIFCFDGLIVPAVGDLLPHRCGRSVGRLVEPPVEFAAVPRSQNHPWPPHRLQHLF